MLLNKEGQPIAEVPAGKRDLFNRLTTWLQVKTQKPLGTYRPIWAAVGVSWFRGYSWRGWYYGQFDERERLIRNGRWFIRIAAPGLLVLSLRIGKYRIDSVLGYRPNGVIGITPLRVQTDESASVVDDPDQDPNNNQGQARGLEPGWR